MKRTILVPLAIAAAITCLVAAPSRADAHSNPETASPAAGQACERQQHVLARAEMFAAASRQRSVSYKNIHERTEARIPALEAKHYKSNKLEDTLQTLNEAVKTYDIAVGKLSGSLSAVQKAACDDAGYTGKLAAARAQLKGVREADQSVHKVLRDQVAKELKAAAKWARNN